MDGLTIAGVVLIAVGTLLVAQAGQRDTKKIARKLDEFKAALTEAKRETSPAAPAKERIADIERDFDSWAKRVLNNSEQINVEVEQSKARAARLELDISDQLRDPYGYFLSALRRAIGAYNKQAGTAAIIAHIPELPVNFFSAEGRAYRGRVQFREDTYWEIALSPIPPQARPFGGIPSLTIALFGTKAGPSDGNFSLSMLSIGSREVNVSLTGTRLPKLKALDTSTHLSFSYKKDLEEAALQLIEAQLHDLATRKPV